MIKRNIEKFGAKVLDEYNKMLFVSGPRQSGKTTFAKAILNKFSQGSYLSWDIINDQKKILNTPYFFENESKDIKKKFLVVFDEIHKYKNWKNYLKGCYDGYNDEYNFIVTGSGRLDLFKKGGDSLFGRYFGVNLFPLSLGELENSFIEPDSFFNYLKEGFDKKQSLENYKQLFNFSGFPEPFLKNDRMFYNLWSNERKKTLIREDIRNAYPVRDISNIEILSNLLPYKVASPLSVNSLREDLSAAFDSIKSWLLLLEQFYYFFSIKPYSKSIFRAIKKEPKIYLYDWAEIEDEAKRFENIVAFHLYKTVLLWKSLGYGNYGLSYIRDKEGREVDFVVTKDDKTVFMAETKFNDENVSKNLLTFQQKTQTQFAIQVVNKKDILKKTSSNGLTQYIISADNFLQYLS
jgi:hypothetical protein